MKTERPGRGSKHHITGLDAIAVFVSEGIRQSCTGPGFTQLRQVARRSARLSEPIFRVQLLTVMVTGALVTVPLESVPTLWRV